MERLCLGIEVGSTRIKACLIDDRHAVVAAGSHQWENRLVAGRWTYDLDDMWAGIRAAVGDALNGAGDGSTVAAIGVSAMMHGYLAFDAQDTLVTPFRTWRNTSTGPAAASLTAALGHNIPLRWSVAHLYQAVLDGEEHTGDVAFLTTLAGYVHWRLTGRKVLGVGDASGMFPIDPSAGTYDASMLPRADGLLREQGFTRPLIEILPEIVPVGREAGRVTADGARLLGSDERIREGTPLCPPEGDAGTGMVATGAMSSRSGNVSVGTSIFSMVVLEKPLSRVHPEIDVVTTPTGLPVAMVHCNNGASELAAWAGVFGQFSEHMGEHVAPDDVFAALLEASLAGAEDAGGILAYNHLAGEPVAGGLSEGRPIVVRTAESELNLANFARSLVYGVFGTLTLGMRQLAEEQVELDVLVAHGGLFRTEGVAQRLLAAAVDAPVAVLDSASEGGAWGAAILAAFLLAPESDLAVFLRHSVFAGMHTEVVHPDRATVRGYRRFMDRYEAGLALEKVAVDVV